MFTVGEKSTVKLPPEASQKYCCTFKLAFVNDVIVLVEPVPAVISLLI